MTRGAGAPCRGRDGEASGSAHERCVSLRSVPAPYRAGREANKQRKGKKAHMIAFLIGAAVGVGVSYLFPQVHEAIDAVITKLRGDA